MAVSQADAASSAANAIVGEGGLIPEQRPHVCVVKDGGVARLPFPSCLSRTIAKLGAKPCQHPGDLRCLLPLILPTELLRAPDTVESDQD
eukprot:3228639-Rhodomonas_salina.1